jgi:hypothetical protein
MGRMNMGKELTGNRVKKMALGGALGALAAGDIRGAIPGVVPQMMVQKKLREEAESAAKKKKQAPQAMAKGGKVRGDGCCMKGKTKGKMF